MNGGFVQQKFTIFLEDPKFGDQNGGSERYSTLRLLLVPECRPYAGICDFYRPPVFLCELLDRHFEFVVCRLDGKDAIEMILKNRAVSLLREPFPDMFYQILHKVSFQILNRAKSVLGCFTSEVQ